MHGLSTLNRLLGKKNKEASRSTTNLSVSTSSLDTSSQHNRISPIVSNAPFEQTFRVTVYLPKNQLYVERIGAKTKLGTLMERISENKHLAIDKYELRHPGDMSQVFDNEKTIGEVGLNELKLVLKSESRFSSDFRRFHADDMMKYKSSVPDSVSSSEISRNYKKPSPYSSTTSLNSLDSTGMNLTAKTQPPVAPARKKRAAPRPPSQNSIPEQEIFGTTLNVFKEPHSILPKKNFHVSSPQLYNNNNTQLDTKSDKNNNSIENGNRLNAITRPTSLYLTSAPEVHQNGSAVRQRSPSSDSSEVQQIFRERQNSSSLEIKKKPAPVPPKRSHKPTPSPRTVQEEHKPSTITEITEIDEHENPSRLDERHHEHANSGNVSKTMLNNSPDSLPSVESSDGPVSIQIVSTDSSLEPSAGHPKLPAVSKVHINPEEERRSSSEDEMTVNIYNVTKSVVTLEKPIVASSTSSPPKADVRTSSITTTTFSSTSSNSQQKSINSQETSISNQQIATQIKTIPVAEKRPIEVEKTIEKKPVVIAKTPSPVEAKKVIRVEQTASPIQEAMPTKEIRKEIESPVIEKKFVDEKVTRQVATSVRESKFVEPVLPPVGEKKVASPVLPPVVKQVSPPIGENKQLEQLQVSPPIVETSKPVVRNIPIEIEERPMSPLWTYTLPAPPVFADASVVDKISPTDRQKSGDQFFSDFASTDCNETVLSDSNTTVVSAETQIHPIIVDRKPSVERFIVEPQEFAKHVADDESDKSAEIITSDLEDGYLGNGKVGKVEKMALVVEQPQPQQNQPQPQLKQPQPHLNPQQPQSKLNQQQPQLQQPQPQLHQPHLQQPQPQLQQQRLAEEIVVEDFRRSRLLIARSDSFHSIGQARSAESPKRSPFSPPQRSTSFLSLVQAQKAEALVRQSSVENAPYSRQKSTSEMSIHDSPSLQSIEVLKNILNSSRKNSLQDASPKEEKVVNFMKNEASRVEKVEKFEAPRENFVRKSEVFAEKSVYERENEAFERKIEVSGRKIEVSEKNPGILGKNPGILDKNSVVEKVEKIVEKKPAETTWKYSGPPKINLSTWNERPKVEVAIAADSDYKFGKVTTTSPRDFPADPDFVREFKSRQESASSKRHTIHISSERAATPEAEMNSKPKVLGVEYKKDVSPVVLREELEEKVTKPVSRTIINIKPRPMSMEISNAYSQIITAPSSVSYNRLNSNAKKFTPVVHGFKLNNIKEDSSVASREPEVVLRKPSAPPSVPAKPNFLRSTSSGEIKRRQTISTVEIKPQPSNLDLPFSQTGLRRTGLKEKILESDKDTKSMFGKVIEGQPEIFTEKVTVRSISHPSPPKPPNAPPPPMNFRKSAPVDLDSRNQLLDAIKNFNRDSLRHK